MHLNRLALVSLAGSVTVLAGCGRPATLAEPAAIVTTATGTAGATLALPQAAPPAV
ncbi:MAG: hypothetical protein FJZ01_19245, partial [Candidatus Sericytochromatia bacterium]|nr:hypothetical protein [Candidatus Tanganyikabacteria bacterium]